MTKTRKAVLIIFLLILGLSCIHPVGRLVVKHFLPLGIGVFDVLGTACFILILLIIIFPFDFIKAKLSGRRLKKKANTSKEKNKTDVTAVFILELAKRDKKNEYLPYFIKVIDIGEKRNNIRLVERFLDYYGQLTLKLLDSQSDLSLHQSTAVAETMKNTEQALKDIQRICNNFVDKLIANDLLDIDVDIEVLGKIGYMENLL